MKQVNKVRAATQDDLEALIELTKDIPKIYGLEDIAPYSPDKTRQAYLKRIQNNLCFVTEKDNEIVSILALSLRGTWWSDKQYLTNDILYAKPGEFNYSLLKEYVEIIKIIKERNEIPFMFDMLAYEHGGKLDIEKKERMFLKLFKGSEKVGSTLRI